MGEHAWQVEEIDGGYLGPAKFWRCPTCGVGGGPALPTDMVRRMMEKGRPERWKPFIMGHGQKVSEDCGEAQKEIREYGEKLIARLRAKWENSKGEHAHYASLFHDAFRWNPDITDVIGVLDLIRDVESPGALRGHRRPSIVDCHHELEKLGFDMRGGALGAAVRELGEDLYQRRRGG